MIIPTVGRIVYFRPGEGAKSRMNILGDQPCKADVLFVHPDGTVNLLVIDHRGCGLVKENVLLIQDGDTPPEGLSYCEWMPYQKVVAKGEIKPTLHAAGALHVSTKSTELDSH
jgi:hypothetical protein